MLMPHSQRHNNLTGPDIEMSSPPLPTLNTFQVLVHD